MLDATKSVVVFLRDFIWWSTSYILATVSPHSLPTINDSSCTRLLGPGSRSGPHNMPCSRAYIIGHSFEPASWGRPGPSRARNGPGWASLVFRGRVDIVGNSSQPKGFLRWQLPPVWAGPSPPAFRYQSGFGRLILGSRSPKQAPREAHLAITGKRANRLDPISASFGEGRSFFVVVYGRAVEGYWHGPPVGSDDNGSTHMITVRIRFGKQVRTRPRVGWGSIWTLAGVVEPEPEPAPRSIWGVAVMIGHGAWVLPLWDSNGASYIEEKKRNIFFTFSLGFLLY